MVPSGLDVPLWRFCSWRRQATESYEQASYAIQETPDVVRQHRGRFLAQDRAALAAKILNQV
jgi:hypothetical protein